MGKMTTTQTFVGRGPTEQAAVAKAKRWGRRWQRNHPGSALMDILWYETEENKDERRSKAIRATIRSRVALPENYLLEQLFAN